MSHATSLPVVRFSLAGILSVIATFLLFFLMQNLIRSSVTVITEDSGPVYTLDFVRVKPVEHVNHINRVEPPPAVKEQPPLPPVVPFEKTTVETSTIVIGEVVKEIGPGPGNGGGVPSGEGDYLPIFKVIPVYPIAASTRGIEGYTIVEYTVTTNGSTRDIRVIEAEPSTIFNRASIEAAAKFKYKPRVIDGTAVEVRGVKNMFTFELE